MKTLYWLALPVTFAMAACSKPSVPDFTNLPAVAPVEKTVSGPSLDGNWASDCLAGSFSTAPHHRLTLKISGSQIESDDVSYGDTQCISSTQHSPLKGSYIFSDQTNDIYTIKYHIPLNSNAWQEWYQKVQLSGQTLNVSSTQLTQAALPMAPSIALHKDNGTPPPTTGTDVQAGFYTDATQRYCDETVSTGSQNGALSSLSVTLESPCSGTTLLFVCSGGRCVNDESDYIITPIDAHSYRFAQGSDSGVIFRK